MVHLGLNICDGPHKKDCTSLGRLATISFTASRESIVYDVFTTMERLYYKLLLSDDYALALPLVCETK